MISMTGYGRATVTEGHYEVRVEISSVNKRNLDVSVSLPREWQELEPVVAERVRGAVKRGKVHVSLRAEVSGEGGVPVWRDEAVGEALERLRELAERQGVAFAPDLDLLYRIASQVSEATSMPPATSVRERIEAGVDEALGALTAMREREGNALAADLRTRLGFLKKGTADIGRHAVEVTPRYREILHQRLRQAGLDLDPDDERVLKEIALFADRCDVTEEVTRLKSHLGQLGGLLDESGEPVGRKAEFLLQEIHREVNTIGSKANDLRISKCVIECKNELERIREQVQNVE